MIPTFILSAGMVYFCNPMKRLIAILFIVIILFNAFGHYFVFWYNRYALRSEMRVLTRGGYFDKSGTTLRITDPALDPTFKRIGHDEFVYRGVLYDIISESRSGHTITFKCINDTKEEKLINNFHHYLDQMAAQNNPSKTKHARALLHHVITLALVESPLPEPNTYLSEFRYFSFNSPLSHFLQHSLDHPPKVS